MYKRKEKPKLKKFLTYSPKETKCLNININPTVNSFHIKSILINAYIE